MNSIDLLKKYGMRICIYNMFGLPGETLKNALQTIEFNQRIKPDVSFSSIFHPLPGTDISLYSIKKQYIESDDLLDRDIEKTISFKSVLKQPEIESVMNLGKLANIAIYFPFLTNLIIKLSRLPDNKLFNFIYTLDLLVQSIRLHGIKISKTIQVILNYLIVRRKLK